MVFAYLKSFTAADAFHSIRRLVYRQIHRKGPLACLAAGTFSLINFKPVQGDRIKQAVDGSQRTQIAAKRTIYLYGPHHNNMETKNLPAKQKTKPGSE